MNPLQVADRLILKPLAAGADVLRRLAYSDPEVFPVLFDSAAIGSLGRYSILAAYPQASLWLDTCGNVHSDGRLSNERGFLNAFEQAWLREHRNLSATEAASPLPFRGGWVVYLGYELATEIEPRLSLAPRLQTDALAPMAFALRIPAGIVYDHSRSQAWAFAEREAGALLDRLGKAVATRPAAARIDSEYAHAKEEDPERFRARVEAALKYIGAGDVYQANLSRAWHGELSGAHTSRTAAAGLYERLRTVNPAPFAALAQFQNWRLLSSSPERLIKVHGTRVETRPIAGTRPRSGIDGQDAGEMAALLTNPKERAEHVMLIDLERNDLGRICRAGSVRTDEFMAIESYAHVHHIVSNVCGERLPDLTPVDVLRAVFPGGTITGCPKFRCMQIIAELEAEAREAYTGALGFINLDGSMDFNILIRSLTLHDKRVVFRTGAGIVADSDWQRELAETQAKARGVLHAFGQSAAREYAAD
jgi:anthranilate synthase component 1